MKHWTETTVERASVAIIDKLGIDEKLAQELVCIAASEFLKNTPGGLSFSYIAPGGVSETWGTENILIALRVLKDNLYDPIGKR